MTLSGMVGFVCPITATAIMPSYEVPPYLVECPKAHVEVPGPGETWRFMNFISFDYLKNYGRSVLEFVFENTLWGV